MADMSSMLSEIFEKTANGHSDEDFEKQANLQFFVDLCANEGIDLSTLNDGQVAGLFKTAMDAKDEQEKAEKGEKGEGKDGEKEKEAAEAKLAAATDEWLQKRAAHTKVAEAEFMGRLMARTFADELKKMAAAGENPFAEKGKEEAKEKGEKGKDEEKEEEKKASARNAALAELLGQHKQASATPTTTPNFDEVAAWEAISMLKSAGIPEETAFERVNAAYILGLPESAKIAAAATAEMALEQRALEICEQAGYKVDWAQA